ncbi:MAG: pantoate--beta-alanine ligase [Cytophagaceae bacterium]|nr:pantoate--beta-alanine ligase [Cytophagaceae bacterium]
MEVFKDPSSLQKFLFKERCKAKSLGFAPTMGALHQGHISLIQESRQENNLTVASIFVNPLQFNNTKDLELYPRTLEKDLKMLEDAGTDVVFLPSAEEVYKDLPRLKVNFGHLEEVMEGKFRPGHFNGVAIIVAKLFHYVNPDRAYFGQKDLQQFLIIQQMVKDLSFPIQLKCCPIIRERDGLAMSSRNMRLSQENRQVAAEIYRALLLAKDSLGNGIEKAKEKAMAHMARYKELEPEYFEIADGETLAPVKDVKEHGKLAICAAVNVDGVRLIDNILIKIDSNN